MGWLNNILGNGGVIDGIKEGIDKSILTEEERLDYQKGMLEAYQPFKLVQRGLALAVTGMFGFILVIEVVLIVLSYWFPDIAHIPVMINELEVVSMVGWGFVSVMSLFFAGGTINSFKSKGN